ncbi:hypothetical protein HYPSUDRAFT_766199 [Hypholoma sublateritium FD-334 SS-4]|uniref:Uncharacterized protein n=1 Tax=Hypholoma sublateritium (strain FD-334 SS-4) TaxID=945553 RepID=A0A0D2PLM1_HYPSF|nr:hypothetical protein HYPSUDRAFT_766199 [Hypholoma sublateritium FD-334 SS-4]
MPDQPPLSNLDSNNLKSSNTNSVVEGDRTWNMNVVNFNNCFVPSSSVDGAGGPSTRGILNKEDGLSAISEAAGKASKTHFAESKAPSDTAPNSNGRSSLSSRRGSATFSSSTISFRTSKESTSRYVNRALNSKKMRDHMISEAIQPHIIDYMSSQVLGNERIIPLWEPAPNIADSPEQWRRNVFIGDVGLFRDDGGFETLFNIFETKEENIDRNYLPPADFVPYYKSLSEAKIRINENRITKSPCMWCLGFNYEGPRGREYV